MTSQLGWEEKINITGWQIEGKNRKRSFIIPQGVEKYDSYNPLFQENILIKSGDRIYVSSASSPLGMRRDLNFRPNRCLGYLVLTLDFAIPISLNCPSPRPDRLPRYLEDSCKEYIKSRAPCESLQYERLRTFNISGDALSLCRDYINSNFSYPGCFANYSQDSDFLINEWHIYMNIQNQEREIMDIQKDTIFLRDKSGLLVDKYNY